VNPADLCMGCMGPRGPAARCGRCGWVEGTPQEQPTHLPPRTLLREQYLLGRVLGHGGFGVTYLGWDVNLDMKLAVKEYFPAQLVGRAPRSIQVTPYTGEARTFFDDGLEKFLDEAKALARFHDHPGIVSILNFFRDNGTGYLVMPFVEGVTLKDYLAASGGTLPYDTALRLLVPVMEALRTVHQAGMLHRDISPDNIYVTQSGQVKILDFGAARNAVGEQNKSLSVILKRGYAPEEQYRTRGRQGPWTDVYALGATLYRALTGSVPPESLDRLEHDDLVPPSRCGVAIPPAAEAALLKSLAVRASERLPSVEAFQQALLSPGSEARTLAGSDLAATAVVAIPPVLVAPVAPPRIPPLDARPAGAGPAPRPAPLAPPPIPPEGSAPRAASRPVTPPPVYPQPLSYPQPAAPGWGTGRKLLVAGLVLGGLAAVALLGLVVLLVLAADPVPKVTAVSFPARIKADGQRVDGKVSFEDQDGDVAKARFQVVSGNFQPFEVEVARGQTSGSVPFWLQTGTPGRVELSVTLLDAQGNASAPASIRFEAQATAVPRPAVATATASELTLTDEQDVTVPDGRRGMLVRASFGITGARGVPCLAMVTFWRDRRTPLPGSGVFRSADGTLAAWTAFTPLYDSTKITDVVVYLPYDTLPADAGQVQYRFTLFAGKAPLALERWGSFTVGGE
jgi:hypothetical protein